MSLTNRCNGAATYGMYCCVSVPGAQRKGVHKRTGQDMCEMSLLLACMTSFVPRSYCACSSFRYCTVLLCVCARKLLCPAVTVCYTLVTPVLLRVCEPVQWCCGGVTDSGCLLYVTVLCAPPFYHSCLYVEEKNDAHTAHNHAHVHTQLTLHSRHTAHFPCRNNMARRNPTPR